MADQTDGYIEDTEPQSGFSLEWKTRLRDFQGPATTAEPRGENSIYWPKPGVRLLNETRHRQAVTGLVHFV